MKQILSSVRKAIDEYGMIEEGDRIAVGLSGGKDSVTLLLALKNLQIFYPKKFEIVAITIDPDSNTFDTSVLEKLCAELNIEYVIEKTNIKEVVFDIRKEKNPCSLCANLRRGALNGAAEAHGCNKVALGHHKDDVIETFLLSLFYEGHIHTFSPNTYLSRKNLMVIRPMIYLEEKEVKAFAKRNNIPIMKKSCEVDGSTKREFMKTIIMELSKRIPRLKACIFGAIERSNIKGWEKVNLKEE
ncbi:MAG: tRNA 2-thiocytidine(32) synthetase TtcA [Clostridia bacterium]|nr:tRNA 2-thiocytidine(32) synthetase TtcA [Clostridia bacterium]